MKNGFTLIELLGVVIILGILTMLIAPNMVKVSNNTKQKLYTAKKKKIEGAAREWGYDNIDNLSIVYSTSPSSSTPTYKLSYFIENGYLSSENKTTTTYINPTNSLEMKDCKIYVWYYKDKDSAAGGKVMASLIQEGNCVCRGC